MELDTRVMQMQVETTDPLEIADEIKGLFESDGPEGFGSFFDEAYPRVVEMGGLSVVARNDSGDLVMHVAAFPRTFRQGGTRLRGGLLGDLLVAERHRDFWTAVHFFRQAVSLLEEGRRFDFLYTDPMEVSFALVRAARFDVLDSLRRFVLPLVPGWLSIFRLRSPVTDLDARQVPWRDGTRLLLRQEELSSGGGFRSIRSRLFYESRTWAQITEASEWTVLDLPAEEPTPGPVGLVLTTPLSPGHALGLMDLFWDDDRVNLESVLYAAAAQARLRGFRKLGVRALDQSLLGRTVRKCGFIPRADDQPVLVKPLRANVHLPPAEEWLLTWIDGSTW